MKAYLAGPDVFLRDTKGAGKKKKALCKKYGFVGIYPMDNKIKNFELGNPETGVKISEANKKLMDSCDLIIANMTPFRGPSMDVGTAFEMGFMNGLGKPVFGYSNIPDLYKGKVVAWNGQKLAKDGRDKNGMFVEDFSLIDNLMMLGALSIQGEVSYPKKKLTKSQIYRDLEAFEGVLKQARKFFG